MKPYSKLSLRERIDSDLSDIDARLTFLAENEEIANPYEIEALEKQKKILLESAMHYDRERDAGYEKPTTHRWSDNSVGGEFRSQTLRLDE